MVLTLSTSISTYPTSKQDRPNTSTPEVGTEGIFRCNLHGRGFWVGGAETVSPSRANRASFCVFSWFSTVFSLNLQW